MATFTPQTPIVTESPLIEVEGLQPGQHRFQLVVEDEQGNRSQPSVASVTVARAAPTIVGLTPPFGDWGDQVVIQGVNFEAEPAKNSVSFNDLNAPVVSATTQQLTVRVPKPATSGPVTVKNGRGEAVSPARFVIPLSFGIVTGPQPIALALEEEKGNVWVVNSVVAGSDRGTVSVVGLAQRKVLITVVVVGTPREIALSPPGGRGLCLVTSGSGTVSVINMSTGQVAINLPTAPNPAGVGISPDGRWGYIVCAGAAGTPTGFVSVLDMAAVKIVATLRVGRAPARVVFSSDGREAFVNNTGDGTLSIIDVTTHKVSDVVKVDTDAASSPQEVNAAAEGYPCWTANQGSSSASIISRDRKVVNAELGFAPSSVAVLRSGLRAFLAGTRDAILAVVDSGQAQPSVKRLRMSGVGAGVQSVVVTPNEAGVIVLHPDANAVSVFDGKSMRLLALVNVPAMPLRCVVTRDGKFACIICNKANALSVIEMESILQEPVRIDTRFLDRLGPRLPDR
jgi:YVTN family beta-propeller protein